MLIEAEARLSSKELPIPFPTKKEDLLNSELNKSKKPLSFLYSTTSAVMPSFFSMYYYLVLAP